MKKFLSLFCLLVFMTVTATVHVQAQSAVSSVLIEAESGAIVLEHNAYSKMPMASTTKIMTAIVALEHSSLDDIITIPSDAVGIEGSSVYLKVGEQLRMEELLYALMLESANDAATAIALTVCDSLEEFSALMNDTAASIGLENTHFTNPHGLYEPDHYTTAYDLALLTRYALTNSDFARIVSTYKTTIPLNGDEGTRVLVNHNKMLKIYDGAIGVKTGYTKKCGRCLVSAAERNGVRMIAVTLSDPDDWNDHISMLDHGFSLYENVKLTDNSLKFQIPCLGGTAETVTICAQDAIYKTLHRDHAPITITCEANHYVCAPISCGDILGEAIVCCGDEEIVRIPLYAANDVPSASTSRGLFERITDIFSMEH